MHYRIYNSPLKSQEHFARKSKQGGDGLSASEDFDKISII
jgi:hypothetical protein